MHTLLEKTQRSNKKFIFLFLILAGKVYEEAKNKVKQYFTIIHVVCATS
jgi:hypothetical protein